MNNKSTDEEPQRFQRLRTAIRTNWWLFAASKDSPRSVVTSRILLVLTPLFIGAGIGITVFHLTGLIPAIIVTIVITLIIGYIMVQSPPIVEEQVEKFLNEDDLITTENEYHPSPALIPTSMVKPVFYRGADEWMAPGHVPITDFINTIQQLDKFVDSIPTDELEDLVEYSYAVNTFSHRRRMPAIKFTDQTEPDSYPITRLRAPYEEYVSSETGPENMPPTPALPHRPNHEVDNASLTD